MQLCISFGTCYSDTLLHLPHGVKGEEQTQTYFTATPTQKSKHSCSMCSACASSGRGGRGSGPSTPHCGPLHSRVRSARGIRGTLWPAQLQPQLAATFNFRRWKNTFRKLRWFCAAHSRSNLPPFPPHSPHFYIFSWLCNGLLATSFAVASNTF